jgi:aspartyl-tRNA(Asn)/glutamyl-tRNA(Gln) amidotransferase subunit A
MMTLLDQSMAELSGAFRRGDVSAVDIARASLARIEERRDLNAFLFVDADTVLKAAGALDQKRASGASLGALAGVPIAIKDALCTHDAPTTCASKILTRRGPDGRPSTPATGFRPLGASLHHKHGPKARYCRKKQLSSVGA